MGTATGHRGRSAAASACYTPSSMRSVAPHSDGARAPSTDPQRLLRVSIIVPVLDEALCLPSLTSRLTELAGCDPACEILVIDGGSTDGTREQLDRSRIPWISAERGRAAQMNAGAAASRGDALLFLHADSRLPADALGLVREAIAGGQRAGFFRIRLDSRRPLLRLVGRLMTLRSRATGIATGDQAIWLERSTFEELGGFPTLPLFEDVELSRRLKRRVRFRCLPAEVVTSARRWERRGPLRTILRMWMLRAAYALGFPAGGLARRYEVAR
jgi:rSAM/selenodomain-associated transferase 2